MTKAIIMAGGEGTRLRPLTCNRAKPMIPVMNRPVIEHAIELLKQYGITDIIISLFYLPENIQNYFADGSEWDVSISYSVEESPLGTAGGVKQAIGDSDETFLVLSGDGIIDFDLSNILKYHREKASSFTIILNRVTSPTEYGIVITDENGRIEKFLEKPSWGEVFTDTANTGMYVIEPEIIRRYVPDNTKFDFSMDLFPLLQEADVPLFGYIAEGYWCDVGALTSYREVHKDILDGVVSTRISGKKVGNEIWAGKDVEIDPEAIIKGPIMLGNFVRIKKGAEIAEFSVIGDNCLIEENASIRRSVLLNSTIIGPRSELRGAIIGKRCVLQEGVSAGEGAVIGDDCRLGNYVTVPAGIRVWPDKMIEGGTRLTTDLIWGQTEKKSLFGSEGIVGPFNVKITPEFAAKLGSALGAYLGRGAKIVMSRDTTAAARLINHAMTAGLLSMGVDVYNMEIESVPVNRYSTRFTNSDMGCYIQISPLTGLQFIQIRLFNRHGFQLPVNIEKKIENVFFRGDYPRKEAFETGHLYYPPHHIESYITSIEKYIDADILRETCCKIIADCFYGTASQVFPALLDAYGCETTVLRNQMKELTDEGATKSETRKVLNNIVRMAKINREIGVIIGPHGTRITIVDELGNILTDNDISAILCLFYLRYKKIGLIKIPVISSKFLEKLIVDNGGKFERISSKRRVPEEMTELFLEGENQPRYPFLEHIYDPMITFLLILNYLALEKKPLYEVKESLPKSNIRNLSLHCTTDEKASIMRLLTSDADPKTVELIDGIRINEENAWIMIMPDSTQPILHVFAEGETISARDDIIEKYTIRIKKYKNAF